MTRTIRWGMIGAGDVTEVKSGPGFQKARNSALVAVMRRDAALARDYAVRHGVRRWYSDAQKLIDDPGGGRRIYCHTSARPQGIYPVVRASGQTCVRRKTDGAHFSRMRGDDRGM
jgi:hypothetical protein